MEEESQGEFNLDELKLGEDGEYYYNTKLSFKTNIYVKGKRFRQCKFLLIEIPVKKISSLDEITSIDEASESLDHSEEAYFLDGSQKIPPEVEFWGHCSNLQVWYENDYDTRLIHRNLAFPLLRELTDAGDPLAKRVFREEIAQRFESGYLPVVSYLLLEEYTSYLSDEYFKAVAQSQNMVAILFKAVESRNSVFKFLSLYLFHRLYNYLNDEIIQKFVDFIKQDEDYVKNLLIEPVLLTNALIYYNPNELYSIRIAVILDIMKEQCHSITDYKNFKWNHYLEEIIFDTTMVNNSINLRTQDLVFAHKISYIGKFLVKAFEKDGKLTKRTIHNCEQKFEEKIVKAKY